MPVSGWESAAALRCPRRSVDVVDVNFADSCLQLIESTIMTTAGLVISASSRPPPHAGPHYRFDRVSHALRMDAPPSGDVGVLISHTQHMEIPAHYVSKRGRFSFRIIQKKRNFPNEIKN